MQLLNTEVRTRAFTDSKPLLESIGSSGQIEEKVLRQSVAHLKQALEEGEIVGFSWIEGSEIVADIFTKQGSKREVLEEIVEENRFKHALSKKNLVVYEGEEFEVQKEFLPGRF